MTNEQYYTEELKKVNPGATKYQPTIKVFANGNGQDTKHISLNKDSAAVFIQWLTDNYINQ